LLVDRIVNPPCENPYTTGGHHSDLAKLKGVALLVVILNKAFFVRIWTPKLWPIVLVSGVASALTLLQYETYHLSILFALVFGAFDVLFLAFAFAFANNKSLFGNTMKTMLTHSFFVCIPFVAVELYTVAVNTNLVGRTFLSAGVAVTTFCF
jgi:hypothetical protein